MRPYGLALIIAGLTACAPAQEEVPPETIDEARAAVQALANSLQHELKAAMQQGPAHAIEVCNHEAGPVARAVSESQGLRVGRTSLRLRNPANAPDPWERNVLLQFQIRMASGETPDKLEFYEIVRSPEGKEFRYMKAIPTQPLCLNCHGESLATEVGQRLEELYPNDEAVGFKVSELRGAFTVRKRLSL